MTRLLLAGAVAASLAAVSAPAHAQPCVMPAQVPTVYVCAINGGWYERGAAWSAPVAGWGYVIAGCYYPDGKPHYYAAYGTSLAGGRAVTVPVSGVPCV
jgi:hypothetical protein